MSNATDYANSIASQIERDADHGTPFGIVSDDNPVTDRENGEDVTAMDWLADVLDIQYLVSSDRQYRGARVCIAFGGPTAWINTHTGQLEVAWWSATEYRDLPRRFTAPLDDALEELWDMGA